MIIRSVGYSRLVSLGNFENEKISATAELEDGEDAEVVLVDLKGWVNERLANRHRQQEEEAQFYRARADLSDIEAKLRDAKRQWDQAKEVLDKHGVKVASEDLEALPF
jgi:hypothetical protein